MLLQTLALCFAVTLMALLCWGSYFLGTMRDSISLPGIDVYCFRMQAAAFLVHPYVKLLNTINTNN